MQNYTVAVALLVEAILRDLSGLLFAPTDSTRPAEVPLKFGDRSISAVTILRALFKKIPIGDGVAIEVEGDGLDEVLVALGAYSFPVRHSAWNDFNSDLVGFFGDRDWPGFCRGVVAQGNSALGQRLMLKFRTIVVIDLVTLLLIKLMATDVAQEFKDGQDPSEFQALVRLCGEASGIEDFLQSWCELLDVKYGAEPGSFYARVEQYMIPLD